MDFAVLNSILSFSGRCASWFVFLAGITLVSYAPLFTFGSESTLIGLEGDAITLRAFFSGRYVQVVLILMQSVIGDDKFHRSRILLYNLCLLYNN